MNKPCSKPPSWNLYWFLKQCYHYCITRYLCTEPLNALYITVINIYQNENLSTCSCVILEISKEFLQLISLLININVFVSLICHWQIKLYDNKKFLDLPGCQIQQFLDNVKDNKNDLFWSSSTKGGGREWGYPIQLNYIYLK